ncbi:response regulator, partial [Candidatus Parcubacteria bacterium]|nr:response regulator [Candidatus Parcubacteria bacterium]
MNKDKKILIIEDEQILGDILLNKLYEEGYTAAWELNGEDGLKKMREMKPDLVLLDLVMPKKDGYEVLQEMRADKELASTAVIIISNSGQPVEIEKILALGAKDYIVKAQFSPDEVLEKIRKHLGSSKPAIGGNKSVRGVKILIVEDDPFLVSLAAGRLEKEG